MKIRTLLERNNLNNDLSQVTGNPRGNDSHRGINFKNSKHWKGFNLNALSYEKKKKNPAK